MGCPHNVTLSLSKRHHFSVSIFFLIIAKKNAMKNLLVIVAAALMLVACQSDYEKGVESFNIGYYCDAQNHLRKVHKLDDDYSKAQMLLNKIYFINDSINKVNDSIRCAKIKAENKKNNDKKNILFYDNLCSRIYNVKTYENKINCTSVDDVMEYYNTVDTWVVDTKLALKTDVDSIIAKADIFKKEYKKYSKPIFKKLRSSYYSIIKDKLWRENIDVQISGSNKDKLLLVGSFFASNANVADSYKAMRDIVYKLRFKSVSFKWYEYDNGWKYTIDSKSDTEF